jgi:hypothetical protein
VPAEISELRSAEGNGMTVGLDLEPYGSRVLVFSKTPARPTRPPSRTGGGGPEPLDLSDGWKVTFGPGASPVIFDRLRSWTDDEATRYFSGLATYTKDVMVPAAMAGRGRKLVLDFGEGRPVPAQPLRSGMQAWLDAPVREAAVVYVNDRRAGSIWCPPYSIDISDYVHPGTNTLRIIVANLAINHMAGHALPSYRLLNLKYGARFDPQDMDKVQPVPAGLLGQIRLMPVE